MALADKAQVEELADKITGCADAIHVRLIQAIKNKEIDHVIAQLIFQDETILRQRANGLYIDAANCVVIGLSGSQRNLIKVINLAKAKIATIETIERVIDLIADILVVAAAAYAAKPDSILAALKEVKTDIDELDKYNKEG
jgi:hypothetical protein